MGPVKSYLNEVTPAVTEFPVTVAKLAALIALIDAGKVNFSTASQRLFPELIKSKEADVEALAQRLNLIQDSDEAGILAIIEKIIDENPEKVKEYKKGKSGILGMFMGEVKKQSKGKADPKVANQLLIKKLNEA
jgi:aspartyl-tRNA(Asn)/glutamyl-tRNA(Gln) amidotransferase subunit B